MLCIIAPEYESADDDHRRSTDGGTDSETESEDDAADGGDLTTVGAV
ncbi:hypothetical protein ACFQMA_22860 [Halosimplex aquaticum]|uniref:Uncharacterized protein n=1 Tax=Halosimplex aquaticum TaxID=3026162 RepID=A0ABD5YAE0_9EURY|nr:hypothetical protein [Halosimplex aquaticum]